MVLMTNKKIIIKYSLLSRALLKQAKIEIKDDNTKTKKQELSVSFDEIIWNTGLKQTKDTDPGR